MQWKKRQKSLDQLTLPEKKIKQKSSRGQDMCQSQGFFHKKLKIQKKFHYVCNIDFPVSL